MLVAVVLALAVLLALPNVFGEENALQLVRDRAAVHASDRDPWSSCCNRTSVTPTGVFLDQGRLTLRFASKQDQLKARDVIAEAHAQRVHHGALPGFARAGLDAQHRLESV